MRKSLTVFCWHFVAGGLHDAVAALKEALVLPAKYSHLLAAAPLRLRTGNRGASLQLAELIGWQQPVLRLLQLSFGCAAALCILLGAAALLQEWFR